MNDIRTMQALRCRDPSLAWCSQDIARWEMVRKLMDEGKQLSSAGDNDSAVRVFTQVRAPLEIDTFVTTLPFMSVCCKYVGYLLFVNACPYPVFDRECMPMKLDP